MGLLSLARTTAIVGWVALVVTGQPTQGFLSKPTTDAIRVLTWNVYRNSIIPPANQVADVAGANRPAQFARVLRALQPDVACLQEVTVSAQRSAALVDQILPLQNGRTWRAHGAVDTVIVSRFDLGARGEGRVQDGNLRRGHAIAMIDSPTVDLYVMCAHFQSSDSPRDIKLRQRQAELVVKTIRDARTGRGAVPLPARTPFIILGDFNAIPGGATFVDAIVSGNASPTAPAEPTNGLDWDRSALTDARPRHNVSRSEVYTWRNDREPFPPGALDRILYSDSVLASVNQFVLDTTVMSDAELAGAGLRASDVMRDPKAGIHDHLPLVIDLVIRQDKPRP
jgi:endonuclease/exonuclease/phosphatase family metal-dependent hydrolase